jgi:DNA polymerase elongation subunit (family B)
MLQFPEVLNSDDCIKYATEIASKVTAQLPEPMALNFEEYYQKMILMNKKRYIMMKQDGTLKYKGVMIARRGYCQYAKDIYKEVIMRLAKEETTNSLKEYIDTKIIDLFSGKVDLSELTITKSVKAINEYKSDVPQVVMAKRLIEEQNIEISAGTRLEYIFVHKDDPKCNQGAKMYTPEEVVTNDLKVDYKYYIEKQIVSQVDELLDLVGLTDYVKNWFSHF